MKTTELYIEQVIIGFLVLAIVALPWAPELSSKLGDINIAEGSVLLGLAFLLGIPFERFADTLSERLDRQHRLQFALAKWDGQKFPEAKEAPDNKKLKEDIFPEDEYRLNGLRDKDPVVNWIEYHRSRIRLARALAVYGPALTLSLTIWMARSDQEMSRRQIAIWLSGIAGYVVWGIVASSPRSAWFGEELPRTDDARFREYTEMRGRINHATDQVQEAPRGGVRVWSDEWRSLVVPILVLGAAFFVGLNHEGKTAWVAVCGGLMTMISTWSWWRISTTYRTYLSGLSPKKPTRGCDFI